MVTPGSNSLGMTSLSTDEMAPSRAVNPWMMIGTGPAVTVVSLVIVTVGNPAMGTVSLRCRVWS